jgi:glutaredoxin
MLQLFVLKGCPYCADSIDLVKKNKMTYKLVWVNDNQKDFYKKQNKMNTFPQILYKTSESSKSGTIIGGSTDLEQLVHSIKTIKTTNLSSAAIKNLMDDIN